MSAPAGDLHVSNALTYASIAAAVGAIAAVQTGASDGAGTAGALLAAAAIFDTFDGRFARSFARTPRQAAAGRELDSLADVLVFGLTPVVVMSAHGAPAVAGSAGWSAWWLAAFVYVIAAVTRLAHFNVEDDGARFTGVPTPAIALVWSTALLWPLSATAVVCLYVAGAAAMIAPIPIPRPRGPGLALFACWAAALVVGHLN